MSAIELISKNADCFKERWKNKGNDERRFLTLVAEIGELADSIKGKHEHPVEVELIQIAGICVNWLNSLDGEIDFQKALKVANHE